MRLEAYSIPTRDPQIDYTVIISSLKQCTFINRQIKSAFNLLELSIFIMEMFVS